MKLFLVTYDLDAPGQNYSQLIKELARIGKRITLSDWVIAVTGQTATQVRDALKTYLDRNDRIAVLELPDGLQWATYNGLAGAVDTLERERPFYA